MPKVPNPMRPANEVYTFRVNNDVRLESNKSQKYILAEGEGKIFLWGNSVATWHKDIAIEIPVKEIFVKGGGKIKIVPEQKAVYVWDKSSRYGEPPFDVVERILKEFFKGYEVIQEPPPGE